VSGFRPRFFLGQESSTFSRGDRRTPDGDPGGPGLSASEGAAVGAELTLGPEDSHHALRVLRLHVGDDCEVVAGAAVYAASVSRAADPVKVRLITRLEGATAGAVYRSQVGLVQALPRPALLDQVLEKGTEVGASFFVLVPSAGSPRRTEPGRSDRLARWHRIVLEAAKQSKQTMVPRLELLDSVEGAISHLAGGGVASLVLEPGAPMTLKERLAGEVLPSAGAAPCAPEAVSAVPSAPEAVSPAPLALWVGPESGWSDTELHQFAAAGMTAVGLGRSILKTETAGPVAVAVARLVTGDW
jgi:16S rRNA (uracil1498-N3)-methyltransferase